MFYNDIRTLWSPETGENKTTNLLGSYSWPFNVTLPREINLQATSSTRGTVSAIKSPPSFTSRASPGYIDYRLIVTFRRGALRVDQT
jgi:hypothetical protein